MLGLMRENVKVQQIFTLILKQKQTKILEPKFNDAWKREKFKQHKV